MSRCPHGAMLLQHGPEGGGHHGRGRGRGERSERVLCIFTREINTLEIFLTCTNKMER